MEVRIWLPYRHLDGSQNGVKEAAGYEIFICNISILTAKIRSLLPALVKQVKGLFVAVPQIARNSTTTLSNNP
jgi:hypothetical protein